MSPPVQFEDEADAEYRQAGRWYEERREGLGFEFFDAVDAAIRQIVDFPLAGVSAPRVPRDLPVRRLAVTRFPYHVVYVQTSKGVRILAVAHDRRKPGYLMPAVGRTKRESAITGGDSSRLGRPVK